MKKKEFILSALIGLSISGSAYAHSQDTDVSPYQDAYIKMVQQSVAQNLKSQEAASHQATIDLSEAVKVALANNHDVKAAKAQYKAAEAKVALAKAAKNPKVNLGYKASRSGGEAGFDGDFSLGQVDPKALGKANPRLKGREEEVIKKLAPSMSRKMHTKTSMKVSPTNTVGGAVSVNLPLYTGGLIEGSTDMAKLGEVIAKANVIKLEEETKLATAKGYFDVIRAANMAAISDLAVKDLEAHLKVVNLSYKVGIVAKSDVLSTEVMMANMKTNQIKAHNAVNLSQAALSRTLALPVDTKIHIKDKAFAYSSYPITLEEATAYGLLHRPEIFQSALAVQVAKDQIRVAKAGFKPKVQASASYSWGSNWPIDKEHSALVNQNIPELGGNVKIPVEGTLHGRGFKNDWSVGIGLSWDLWDGGSTAANVKAAEAAYEAQKEANRNAISGISLDIRQAFLNMRASEGIIKSTKSAVTQAEENLRIATLRYRAGVGTNLDVLDAELKLDQARNAYVEALYDYNLNVAALEKAMGTPVSMPIGEGLTIAQKAEATKELATLLKESTAGSKKK